MAEKQKLYNHISESINTHKSLTGVQFINGVLVDSAKLIQEYINQTKENLSQIPILTDIADKEFLEKNFEPLIYHTKKDSMIANRYYQYNFTAGGSMKERGVKVVNDKTIDKTFDLTEYVKFTFHTHYEIIEFDLSDVLKLMNVPKVVIIDMTCAGSTKTANSTLSNFTNVHGKQHNINPRTLVTNQREIPGSRPNQPNEPYGPLFPSRRTYSNRARGARQSVYKTMSRLGSALSRKTRSPGEEETKGSE